MSAEQLKKAAIIYDFDGTLAHRNLQECSFIPSINMDRDQFWDEVKQMTNRENADEILVYMHLMLAKARDRKVDVTREMLRDHGRAAPLFNGLEDFSWFKRINAFANERGLDLQHYIISSGIEDMIRGCRIQEAFHRIYASKYIYSGEVAAWPGVAINYTTKTQYLFRINKGVENHWDNKAINQYMPEHSRPIPFERMIFLGDGASDIPTMKMLTYQGGHSIAVYDEQCEKEDLEKIHALIADSRADFVAPANYGENLQLDIIVKGILGRIARACQ